MHPRGLKFSYTPLKFVSRKYEIPVGGEVTQIDSLMESQESDVVSENGNQGNDHISESSGHESPTLDTVSGFSTCSSPIPPEPFKPLFSMKFTGAVEKDGDVVKYTLKARKTDDHSTEYIIKRQYEDFEWLEHCLVTSNPTPGLIIPPLPPKPAITSEMAEAKSKKQLGSDTRTLIGDQFQKDCQQLEQYLKLLLSHHVFGKDETLSAFLTEKEPPPRAKVKKGLFSRISDSLESRKGSHRDCEEFFQKERDWVEKYGAQIKETSEAFNSVTYAQQRLCGVLGHLATAFTLSQGSTDGVTKSGTRLCSLFSEALEESRHHLQVLSQCDEATLGSYLDLFVRYIDAERDMLFQRTCLLVEYENANKALDKTKPQRREMAEEAKLAAEKAFEECSDVARQEIKKFHRLRSRMFQESLEKYVESQLRNAKEVSAALTKSLSTLRQFQIVPPETITEE